VVHDKLELGPLFNKAFCWQKEVLGDDQSIMKIATRAARILEESGLTAWCYISV
jgi:hypothetical protein